MMQERLSPRGVKVSIGEAMESGRHGVRLSEGLGSARPPDLNTPILSKAVTQVQIYEALIGDASFFGHAFEVRHNVFRQPHGH